ncbi:MAG: hypothetical protein IKH09_00265 [Clostridia bacterium]|nr:hypothetical protein [Clostridia bacterium]
MKYTRKSRNAIGSENDTTFVSRLLGKFNSWRLSFSIDGQAIAKGVIIAVFIVLFSITQTTLLSRLRPFGAVPDLLLPLVVAVAMSEKEKWGAVVGLISAFVIDALGGVTVMLLPLLYVPVGIFCGLLTTYRFRDSIPVAALFTAVTCVLRFFVSFLLALFTVHGATPLQALLDFALPGLYANLIFAVFPHLFVRLAMRPFHKTRAERTEENDRVF